MYHTLWVAVKGELGAAAPNSSQPQPLELRAGRAQLWDVRIILVALLAVGCTQDPPSCQQAAAHYYQVGCHFASSSGPIAESQFVITCQQAAAQAPADCSGLFDDWLTCLDSVTAAGSATNCDCSQSQMALLACR
jgi:hypothetical protein